MLAVSDADDKLNPDRQYTEYLCRIQAVVPMYGVHDVERETLRNRTHF